MRREQPVERKLGEDGSIEETHPAFGLARLGRTQGSQRLFGSALSHCNGYVTLTIREASRHRSGHGYDFYFGGKDLIEVAFSEAQFAQMITCWNSGEGVPCTIEHVRGDAESYRPTWPAEDQQADTERVREEFSMRVEAICKKVGEMAAALEPILEKKSLTNEDRGKLRAIVVAVDRLVNDSGPFMTKQFVEVTETVLQRAKSEIDAFVTRVVQETGLEALREMGKAVQLPARAPDEEVPPR